MFRRPLIGDRRKRREILRYTAQNRINKPGGSFKPGAPAQGYALVDGGPCGNAGEQKLIHAKAKNVSHLGFKLCGALAVAGYVMITERVILEHAQSQSGRKSEEAASITGDTLVIDGGALLVSDKCERYGYYSEEKKV